MTHLENAVEYLATEEEHSRTPEHAQRLRNIRRGMEALLEVEKGCARGEIPLVCPVCDRPGDFTGQKCPNCGTRLDLCALWLRSGLWKVHVTFLIAFSGLAGWLGHTAAMAHPPVVRAVAGVGALFFGVLSVPSWAWICRLAVWLGRAAKSR